MSQMPAQESSTSLPAVAAGASAEERERLIQEALNEAAYYESQRVSVAAHDAVRANIEAGTASLLRRLTALLRATPAAPVGAPSEDDGLFLTHIREAVRIFRGQPTASLPPVEGAGDKPNEFQTAWCMVVDALSRVAPGWLTNAPADMLNLPAREVAVRTIERLAASAEVVELVAHRLDAAGVAPQWRRDDIELRVAELIAAASDRDAARWRAFAESAEKERSSNGDNALVRFAGPWIVSWREDTDENGHRVFWQETPDEYIDDLLAQQAPKESDDNPSS